MSAPHLRLENVSQTFGTHDILRQISLDIPPGQTLAVIGQSGCGKTILMKILVGLLRPTSGRVLVDDKNLATLTPEELGTLRRRFGLLFQGGALFDSLSVYENVAYPLRALLGLKEAEIRQRVQSRLEEVGLTVSPRLEKQMPAELSGGMRKRVGLARALALDPEVMLYDEPTTGLDPVMTEVINNLIMQTRQRRPITSIVVTHEMKTVRAVADRVLMLYPLTQLGEKDLQIIFDGPVGELDTASDERVRRFVG
jgi:phospholipid/cholesterol/gamma-HCH transport system ATP-binding protein